MRPSSIPWTEVIRRCGNFSETATGEGGDRMARARSARGAGIYSIAGPRWQELRALVERHIPAADVLRWLIPVLLTGFVAIASFGFAYQIGNGKSKAPLRRGESADPHRRSRRGQAERRADQRRDAELQSQIGSALSLRACRGAPSKTTASRCSPMPKAASGRAFL